MIQGFSLHDNDQDWPGGVDRAWREWEVIGRNDRRKIDDIMAMLDDQEEKG